jgi:5-methylcytosine-specific restriction protein A
VRTPVSGAGASSSQAIAITPRAAVAHHKMKHRGDPKLCFDLENVETVCKRDHDTLIQKEEARGYVVGSDINGRPLDPQHPWNR